MRFCRRCRLSRPRAVVVLLFNLAYTSAWIIFPRIGVLTWKTLFAALLDLKRIEHALLEALCIVSLHCTHWLSHSLSSNLLFQRSWSLLWISIALSSVSRNSACLTLVSFVCDPSLPSAYAIGYMVCFIQMLFFISNALWACCTTARLYLLFPEIQSCFACLFSHLLLNRFGCLRHP